MKFAVSAVAAMILSGCASGVRYDNTLDNLMTVALADANEMSNATAAYLKTGNAEKAIEIAKELVANSLRDPGSAQFRNVRILDYRDGKVICGEVNGKNAYGGYSGFSPFVAGTNKSALYSREPSYPAIERAANVGIASACNLPI